MEYINPTTSKFLKIFNLLNKYKDNIRDVGSFFKKLSGGKKPSNKALISKQGYSFSGDDLMNFIDNKANMLTYDELHKYKNIDDCLGKHGVLVLLFLTKPHYGHWTCLIKHGKNKLEFFDSYNYKPDDELGFIPESFKKESKQDYPYLTELLYNSGYDIEYNHTQLQERTKDVNYKVATCGRHVGCRILFKKVPLDKYVNILLENMPSVTPDMIVTYLSAQY